MDQDGSLDVLIDRTFPLEDAASAHRDLESQDTVGKLMLIPNAFPPGSGILLPCRRGGWSKPSLTCSGSRYRGPRRRLFDADNVRVVVRECDTVARVGTASPLDTAYHGVTMRLVRN